MPRKKSEFKPLTYKKIIKINPERENLVGQKEEFKEMIQISIEQEPFDKNSTVSQKRQRLH